LDALKIVYEGERMRLGTGESSKMSFASGMECDSRVISITNGVSNRVLQELSASQRAVQKEGAGAQGIIVDLSN
jgi:hypothetical protein